MGLLTRQSFSHGIHPPERKSPTEDKPVERVPFPDEVVVPLLQNIGAPSKPVVEKGQEVVRGEPLSEPGGFVSVPMHSPVTGKVTRVAPALDASGAMRPAIFIKTSPDTSEEVPWGEEADTGRLSPEQLVTAVQNAGMVGLGGAAFPTHVKMSLPKDKKADTIIVNGCECEPYLTADHRVMLERANLVIAGARLAMRATCAPRAIIGVENNKPDAVAALRAELKDSAPISVTSLKTKYPQGAEKMLIKAVLEREVPSGGLPIDVGVVVFNVATLAQVAYLVPRGQGLIERIITVTGSGVDRPGNYLTPVGTPLRHLLEHAGLRPEARQVVLGGPMMGGAVPSLDIPTTKGVSGVLALTREELDERPARVYPCIRCGQCLEACPMRLNPSRLGALARNEEYAAMAAEYNLNDCFECGCCAYTCPSNIPLVHYFRVAKQVNRERKPAK